jgi:hypothetical protein
MKRTTIFLDDDLRRRLHEVARADDKSFAAVVREALLGYLDLRHARVPGRLPSIAGRFTSGCTDTSQRMEQVAAETVLA